jgi:hypothetical protein
MNNSNRRISLVMPQPTGGVNAGHATHTNSADGRKKVVTDKKKKNLGKVVTGLMSELSSSVERLRTQKFSISGGFAHNATPTAT